MLLERGAHSYVSTFDGHPYVAPFSGNIVELCPVGALTSRPYRFRARPWDIEGAGSVCTLCPAQCNVTLTVRDERVLRVLGARQRRGRRRLAVRQGPLRLPVLPRRRAHHRAAAARRRRAAARSPGSARSRRPPPASPRAGARTGAIAGGGSDQRGGPAARAPDARGRSAPRTWTRAAPGALPLELHRALGDPALQARTSDLEFAHAVLVLDAEPRRRRADPRPAPAQGRAPPRPEARRRRARPRARSTQSAALSRALSRPGGAAAFAAALAAALRRRRRSSSDLAARGGRRGRGGARAGRAARGPAGSGAGRRGSAARGRGAVGRAPHRRARRRGGRARAARRSPSALGIARRRGAGLLEDPRCAQRPRPARGRRAAQRRPGPRRAAAGGRARRARDRRGPARPASSSALYLLQRDPLRDLAGRELWERALRGARAPSSRTPRS